MITESDSYYTADVGRYYVILPQSPSWNYDDYFKIKNAKKVPDGFTYNSGSNEEWLSEGTATQPDQRANRSNIHGLNLEFFRKKLALGTVQLGVPYGINNQTGKPDQDTAFGILHRAAAYGVHVLDSADAYGDSLQVIGAFLRLNPKSSYQVISKFVGDEETVRSKVARTLELLRIPSLYGYMFHRFADYRSGKYIDDLLRSKEAGLIGRIGVSLYDVDELETVIADKNIDVLQIPFNPFDASSKKIKLLKEFKNRGGEVHVRSVFLQGLFFKDPASLSGNMVQLGPALEAFHNLLRSEGIPTQEACLNFALHQPFIDFVLIGVETIGQLEENVNSVRADFSQNLKNKIELIFDGDTKLLNPSNWRS